MTTMTTELAQLRPDEITPHPKNPRTDIGDVTELADSIREQGLLEPLIVTADYQLIAGHRRLRAAADAGLPTVPCIVRADLDTEAKQLEAMLVENLQRADLTPVEEATAYEQLRIHGYDPKRIAKATGRSKATVDKRLALMKLGEDTRAKVHAHEITLAEADVLVEFAGDEKATAELEQYLGSGNWQWAVQRQRERRDAKRETAKRIKKLRDAGAEVLTTPPDGYPWSGGVRPLVHLGVDEDEHGDCPGDVYVMSTDHGGAPRLTRCCKDLAQHKADAGDDGDGEGEGAPTIHDAASQAEREERQREQDQLASDLETAAAVRVEWTNKLIGPKSPLTQDQVLTILRARCVSDIDEGYVDLDDIHVLRLYGFHEAPEGEAWYDQAKAAIETWSLEQCAKFLLVATDDNGFRSLVQPWSWRRGNPIALLQKLGYQASDVEQRLIDEYNAAEAERAAQHEADEGGGDA